LIRWWVDFVIIFYSWQGRHRPIDRFVRLMEVDSCRPVRRGCAWLSIGEQCALLFNVHINKKGGLVLLLNRFLLLVSFGIFFASAVASPLQNAPQVMGWVPAYGMVESIDAIESSPMVSAGLTRMGLQFWNPSADGQNVVLAPVNKEGEQVQPKDVIRFRDWAKKHHIEVFLTVYNNSQVSGKWDWALAKRAFSDNREAFSDALLKEMHKYGLDGIDLDLEGEGDREGDRVAYALFVKELSQKLKSQKKMLTIDSFHSPCDNAPNMRWWGDWVGQVDAIHSMGYEDLYEGSVATFTPNGRPLCEQGAHIFKYSWQRQFAVAAGYKSEQLLVGVPTWLDSWGEGGLGTDPVSHVREAQALGVGIALWDLQLAGPKWRNATTWAAIKELRLRPRAVGKARR
jgi:hypothetical protein